ncbi:MAG: UDP-2,4-diacetamido-2,4,6-trideoxy-beta-L-altropyranose hydrolase [Pseudomonadota bacterium]
MDIAIRADASADLGIGHLMRCQTLADHLLTRGLRSHFVCAQLPDYLRQRLEHAGHRVTILQNQELAKVNGEDKPGQLSQKAQQLDASETARVLGNTEYQWLIIDHYALDHTWQQQLNEVAASVLVVDDLANREHRCDLLVDQTLGRRAEDYRHRVPGSCQLLVGASYAMLRPEFAQLRSSNGKRARSGEVSQILVSVGGTDPLNLTVAILSELELTHQSSAFGGQIKVVLGSTAPAIESVRTQISESELDIELMLNVENMAALLNDSDLVIGAAGGSAWERCCLGLPSAMVVVAENQNAVAEALSAAEAAVKLDRQLLDTHGEPLHKIVERWATKPAELAHMSRQAASLVDGLGVRRVGQAMLGAD